MNSLEELLGGLQPEEPYRTPEEETLTGRNSSIMRQGEISFTGGPGPYSPDIQQPQIGGGLPPNAMGPVSPPQAPQASPRASRRSMLEDRLMQMLNQPAPAPPDTGFKWNEALAAAINPNVVPLIQQRKMTPYLAQQQHSQQQGDLLRTLLGMTEPQRPVEAGGGLYDPESQNWLLQPQDRAERPITTGPGDVVIDPRTGQPIYTNPNERDTPANRPQEVSPGGYLVDPVTGKVIFKNPNLSGSAKEGEIPPSMWLEAVQRGKNPFPPESPYYAQMEAALKAFAGTTNPRLQDDLGRVWNEAFQKFLSSKLKVPGMKPSAQDMQNARAYADQVRDQYKQNVGISSPQQAPLTSQQERNLYQPTPGQQRPSRQERMDQLIQSGYSDEQVTAILKNEYP